MDSQQAEDRRRELDAVAPILDESEPPTRSGRGGQASRLHELLVAGGVYAAAHASAMVTDQTFDALPHDLRDALERVVASLSAKM